jgi:hypothetical protein
VLGVCGSDANEPRGAGKHVWDWTAVPAVELEVEEYNLERGRIRWFKYKHVGRAAVVEEDAVTRELVASAAQGCEECVSEWLVKKAVSSMEELAQSWSRDVLHEDEVGVPEWRVDESDNTVEYWSSTYAEVCDAQVEGDFCVDDLFEVDFRG